MKTARREQLALAEAIARLSSLVPGSFECGAGPRTGYLILTRSAKKHILNARISHGDDGKAGEDCTARILTPTRSFPGIRRKNNGDVDLIVDPRVECEVSS